MGIPITDTLLFKFNFDDNQVIVTQDVYDFMSGFVVMV